MRGLRALALGFLLVAAWPAAAEDQNQNACPSAVADAGAVAVGSWGAAVQSTGVTLDNNSSTRISIARWCALPQQQPPPESPRPVPPLAIESAYATWTGPGEIGVSWWTNIPSTGRVAWGLEPGSFLGYADVAPAQESHVLQIANAPHDLPLHITVIAISAAGEMLQVALQGPSPHLAPPPPATAAPNWPLVVAASMAAVGAVLTVRASLVRRK